MKRHQMKKEKHEILWVENFFRRGLNKHLNMLAKINLIDIHHVVFLSISQVDNLNEILLQIRTTGYLENNK